ncbi:hypothetical protein QQP08_015675 [Theobroma cacao]|nr:hypothetical protein QQP08_015675 [Theobroma cacao]
MIDLPLAFSNGNKQIVRYCVGVWINNSRRQTVADGTAVSHIARTAASRIIFKAQPGLERLRPYLNRICSIGSISSLVDDTRLCDQSVISGLVVQFGLRWSWRIVPFRSSLGWDGVGLRFTNALVTATRGSRRARIQNHYSLRPNPQSHEQHLYMSWALIIIHQENQRTPGARGMVVVAQHPRRGGKRFLRIGLTDKFVSRTTASIHKSFSKQS